ncbi:unnamed protein product [Mycena citricolor]|uniref:Uncharacterized protein n=1 Tax=Mycena citricolor TaxID=2018698 RepID=A0AAD2Q3I3_9AGAR|nr:unnamed protein product [Mycena citricolor]CAK5272556.1 unnamed protein product [Mycena citricolor]
MFIPYLTPRSPQKGGGGAKGGGSSSSSSSSGGKGSSSSSSSGTGKGTSSSSSSGKTSPISSSGGARSATTYNFGGGKSSTIPSGQTFAGRSQGGANRNQIWGTRTYGSGYPGIYSRGVAGRGFPFYFWPVVWGSGAGYTSENAYLHDGEYGDATNSSRPGGPMASATFQSNSTASTFHLIADNTTVGDLISAITSNCSSHLVTPLPTGPTPLNSSGSGYAPEQVVQYYRASSVALTLDGYNNSAVFAAENSTADTPLPSGIDPTLLDCLNSTIGQATPLIDAGIMSRGAVPPFGLLLCLIVWVQWLL